MPSCVTISRRKTIELDIDLVPAPVAEVAHAGL